MLAWPFGIYSPETDAACGASWDIFAGFTIEQGRASRSYNVMALPRYLLEQFRSRRGLRANRQWQLIRRLAPAGHTNRNGKTTNHLSMDATRSILLLALVVGWCGSAHAYDGKVIDATTKRPIESAMVTVNDTMVRTDKNGHFEVKVTGESLGARAYGATCGPTSHWNHGQETYNLELTPFRPKALYLSFYGAGSTTIRRATPST